MPRLTAALTGAALIAFGRVQGFARFATGPADVVLAVIALALGIAINALADGETMAGLPRSLGISGVIVLAEIALCYFLAIAMGRLAGFPRFVIALMWAWALASAAVAVLGLPLALTHGSGADRAGAQNGMLLIGGGFFLLVGLYLVWLNFFLLHRGLALGSGASVIGVILMIVVLSIVSTGLVMLDPAMPRVAG